MRYGIAVTADTILSTVEISSTAIQSRGLTLPDDEVAAGHHDPRLISGSIDALGIIEPEINIIGGLIAALCYGFLQHLKDDILANVFDLQVLRVDGHRLAGIGELHIDRFAISQIIRVS